MGNHTIILVGKTINKASFETEVNKKSFKAKIKSFKVRQEANTVEIESTVPLSDAEKDELTKEALRQAT